MRQKIRIAATAALVCASLLMAGAQAQTAPTESAGAPAKTKSKKKSAGRQKMPKFMSGSQETVKERSARLMRECKGAVNAGACKGYTN